jgi:acetyl-CoA carboxylase biotin carboxylase subunit
VLNSVLVANRGEIARRIIRTVRGLGLRAIAVHSEVDADLPYVREADEAILLGPAPAAASYRNAAALLEAAKRTGADGIHPGYGFLSENAGFAAAVVDAGLVWVGPPPHAIAAMGDKVAARNLVAAAGVPVAPGTGDPVMEVAAALAAAERIGYPVMVKAAAGGGGMGITPAFDADMLRTAFAQVAGIADRLFGHPDVLLERYFPHVRHVEVQVVGLPDGRVVALGERDCSVQRRNQKLVEESPSPGVDDVLRDRLVTASIRAALAVGYRNAGTVEFLLDTESGAVSFCEMNTRLQVEHPVTELQYGVDLVAVQLAVADGQDPGLDGAAPSGHAVEFRVNAEDPQRFLPRPGLITRWAEPSGVGVRVDAGYAAGTTVTSHYDSLLAKLIVRGSDRAEALARAARALAAFEIDGPQTTLPFHRELLGHPEFVSGQYDTGLVGRMRSNGVQGT